MKALYIILILNLMPLLLSAQVWESKAITLAPSLFGTDLSVVDENVVWLGYWSGDFSFSPWHYSFDAHHFSKTTDGGETWITDTFPSTGAGYFSNIFALDSNVAYISFVDFGEGPKLFQTEDGGQSWNVLETGISTWINYVYFFSRTDGAVMGDPDSLGFILATTNDAGITWQRLDPAGLPAPLPEETGVSNFFTSYGDHILFATSHGRVFHSADRGLNWNVLEGPLLNEFPSGMAARDGAVILQFGDFSDTVTFIHSFQHFRTADEGNTWEDITPDENNAVAERFTYIPGTQTLIGGFRSNNVNGPFSTQISYDDGSSWTTIDEGTRIWDTDFISDEIGFASEYKNDTLSPLIYKYTGSPLTGLFNRNALQGDISIFPNPVDNIIYFKIDMDKSQDATVWLNDQLGRLIQRINYRKGQELEGTLYMENHAPGAYILTISTNKGVLSKYLIKQ